MFLSRRRGGSKSSGERAAVRLAETHTVGNKTAMWVGRSQCGWKLLQILCQECSFSQCNAKKEHPWRVKRGMGRRGTEKRQNGHRGEGRAKGPGGPLLGNVRAPRSLVIKYLS